MAGCSMTGGSSSRTLTRPEVRDEDSTFSAMNKCLLRAEGIAETCSAFFDRAKCQFAAVVVMAEAVGADAVVGVAKYLQTDTDLDTKGNRCRYKYTYRHRYRYGDS